MKQQVAGTWQNGKNVVLSLNPDIELVVNENGPKATDLVLAGLVSCSIGVLLEILAKMRVSLKTLKVVTEAERDVEPPKLFTKIKIIYQLEVDEEQENKVIKAIKLGKSYCTVFNILQKSADIEVECYVNGNLRNTQC
ncbi:OsmC family protein [Desulfosporosinus sp. FKB]|uniref:OsmC family protein n=1 Tax=Desulfosporosinus sp. FKB TaxID=1969835 RepID=UPI000B4A2F1D|nr:OsmC family protein [Desulfosporosinus sp. FKB]